MSKSAGGSDGLQIRKVEWSAQFFGNVVPNVEPGHRKQKSICILTGIQTLGKRLRCHCLGSVDQTAQVKQSIIASIQYAMGRFRLHHLTDIAPNG
ncbi:MAG: hypothetical protein AUG75_03650 [Cyanobacteria bacterium 13_1_20CM_4_61_6]|nr:MAG: hypothetical protein AUG75_03650 [Cyanobacteria bacterium 13_1_20CM_4_61_6]